MRLPGSSPWSAVTPARALTPSGGAGRPPSLAQPDIIATKDTATASRETRREAAMRTGSDLMGSLLMRRTYHRPIPHATRASMLTNAPLEADIRGAEAQLVVRRQRPRHPPPGRSRRTRHGSPSMAPQCRSSSAGHPQDREYGDFRAPAHWVDSPFPPRGTGNMTSARAEGETVIRAFINGSRYETPEHTSHHDSVGGSGGVGEDLKLTLRSACKRSKLLNLYIWQM